MSSLQTRIVSAVVALLLAAGTCIVFGKSACFILLYITISIAQLEYVGLALSKSRKALRLGFLTLSQFTLLFSLPTGLFPTSSPTKLALQFFVFICFFGLLSDKKEIAEIRDDIFATCFGYIYLGVIPAVLSITLLKQIDIAIELFVFLLVTVFAGDVFAYFSGLWLGKKKILPSVSPKKTIVGCIGGLLGSVIIGSTFSFYMLPNFSVYVLGLCFLIGLYGQTGDFLESLIKRLAGKKDSGKIMPGHGGILDRIDGVLFAIPAIYFFYY